MNYFDFLLELKSGSLSVFVSVCVCVPVITQEPVNRFGRGLRHMVGNDHNSRRLWDFFKFRPGSGSRARNPPGPWGFLTQKSSWLDFRENRVFRPVFDADSEYELISSRFVMVRDLSGGSGGVRNHPGTGPKNSN